MKAMVAFKNNVEYVTGVVDLDYEKNANAYILVGENADGLKYKKLYPSKKVLHLELVETDKEKEKRLQKEKEKAVDKTKCEQMRIAVDEFAKETCQSVDIEKWRSEASRLVDIIKTICDRQEYD